MSSYLFCIFPFF